MAESGPRPHFMPTMSAPAPSRLRAKRPGSSTNGAVDERECPRIERTSSPSRADGHRLARGWRRQLLGKTSSSRRRNVRRASASASRLDALNVRGTSLSLVSRGGSDFRPGAGSSGRSSPPRSHGGDTPTVAKTAPCEFNSRCGHRSGTRSAEPGSRSRYWSPQSPSPRRTSLWS